MGIALICAGVVLISRSSGVTKPFLPFTRPSIDEDSIAAVADVFRSGQLASGPKVQAFEAALAAYLGSGRHVRVMTLGHRRTRNGAGSRSRRRGRRGDRARDEFSPRVPTSSPGSAPSRCSSTSICIPGI